MYTNDGDGTPCSFSKKNGQVISPDKKPHQLLALEALSFLIVTYGFLAIILCVDIISKVFFLQIFKCWYSNTSKSYTNSLPTTSFHHCPHSQNSLTLTHTQKKPFVVFEEDRLAV